MKGKVEHFGPLIQDLPETWKCIVCDVPPKRGQVFRLVEANAGVTVQHEFLADCGIPETTGPHSQSAE